MQYCVICSDELLRDKIYNQFHSKVEKLTILENYDQILEDVDHFSLYEYDLYVFEISDENKKGIELFDYFELIDLKTPVIFIAHGDKLKLMSLVFGRNAEDYIHIPFDIKELELRISKVMRRKITSDEFILSDEHTYTYSQRAVTSGNHTVALTEKQRKLLYLLMLNKNSVITYPMIQDYVYDGKDFSNNAVATHVRDIRRKIKDINIKAIKGNGYTLKTT